MTGREMEKFTVLIMQWCEFRRAYTDKASTTVQLLMLANIDYWINELAAEAQHSAEMMDLPVPSNIPDDN